jgi:hypothetical protein
MIIATGVGGVGGVGILQKYYARASLVKVMGMPTPPTPPTPIVLALLASIRESVCPFPTRSMLFWRAAQWLMLLRCLYLLDVSTGRGLSGVDEDEPEARA